MIDDNMSVEEFKNSAGTRLGPSDWLLIDQQRINLFADATSDHQFIHVDVEKAASTPFGSTIAHGFLSLSLVSALVGQIMPKPEGTIMGINYGLDKVRFLQPVKVNSRVRAFASMAGELSTPVTTCPSRASCNIRRPVPHPNSKIGPPAASASPRTYSRSSVSPEWTIS